MKTIRTMLLDDHPEFLDAAAHFLSECAAVDFVGSARTTPEALEMIRLLRPDVVLVELRMRGTNGLLAALSIKVLAQPPKVVLFSSHAEPAYRELAAAVSVDGFIAKQSFCQDVVPALTRLFQQNGDRQQLQEVSGHV